MKRRLTIFAIILGLALLMAPAFVEADPYAQGTCGSDLYWSLDQGVLSITGSGAMDNYNQDTNKAPWTSCLSYIVSVTMEDTVTTIGDYAFESCSKLSEVHLSSQLTAIGNKAFQNCEKLSSISIPSEVSMIGEYAFKNCYALTDIVLPDMISSIPQYAFNVCNNLTSLTIPGNVKLINDHAFSGCSKLSTIYYLGTENSWKTITIRNSNLAVFTQKPSN